VWDLLSQTISPRVHHWKGRKIAGKKASFSRDKQRVLSAPDRANAYFFLNDPTFSQFQQQPSPMG